jgi:hypothetical protein
MKKFLFLALCLSLFNVFSQDEDFEDNSEFYRIFYLVDHKVDTIFEFFPIEENIELSDYTTMIYNPYINDEVLDSILYWRESKGSKPIEVNWKSVDERMKNDMFLSSLSISKKESDKVILERREDTNPDCDCVSSICEEILNARIRYSKRKLKDILLDPEIINIEVYYYQVERRESPNKKEEHLLVNVKKRFDLFKITYQIF